MASLYFSDVLRKADIDPAKVKLIRHSLTDKNFRACYDAGKVYEYTCHQKMGFSKGYEYWVAFEDYAFKMLKALNGKKHQVMSGVGVIYKDYHYNFVEVSNVYFKNLSDDEIIGYISTGECFGKAGSYAIQGIGGTLIDHIEGSLNNIIGLPTEKLKIILEEIYGMEN